ncbi:alpha/beta hydrolase family protein [Streptomyces sp. NPDC127068]|uniref:alpha/beta hydrolase family protein n=1 Tax=Streptomyces sp. NPDC127068 TaxID=3347127 RepID=UPI00364F3798
MNRVARPGTAALAVLALTVAAPLPASAAPPTGERAAPANPPSARAEQRTPADPGAKGPYRTRSGSYALPSLRMPGVAAPVEMRASVVGPANASGSRPLVLLVHGATRPCVRVADGVPGDTWPCPAGEVPTPAHLGYRHTQELLASQGYVTVSVSAHGAGRSDDVQTDRGAADRSALIRQHLARWAAWAAHPAGAPAVVRSLPKADPGRVLLVGHGAAGAGVNRAVLDSVHPSPHAGDGYRGPVRWTIRGTALIGPTAHGRNPVPDVPSVTVLPGCDGIAHDLPGQAYVDEARLTGSGRALHGAVYLVGANSNYFNSQLTPGRATYPQLAEDDFQEDGERDPVCGPAARTRLTAGQQRAAGSLYVAASARLFLLGDDRARPLVDGTDRRGARPFTGEPARAYSHAVGAGRIRALVPDGSTAVTGGRLCEQVHPDPARSCSGLEGSTLHPHFAPFELVDAEPGRRAVALRWNRSGVPVRMRPARPFSLSGAAALALRVIVPPNTTGTELDVTVTDAAGKRAKLGRVTVDGVPGSAETAAHWAREVRVPLTAAVRAGLDLGRLAGLELTPRTRSGGAWLLDAWGWRPGTPAVRPVSGTLPRVDLGWTEVPEGDRGARTHHVPVRVAGQGTGRVRVYVYGTDQTPENPTGLLRQYGATVRDGALIVPILVRGDTRPGHGQRFVVLVKSTSGVVVGSHRGGLAVREDDGSPQ